LPSGINELDTGIISNSNLKSEISNPEFAGFFTYSSLRQAQYKLKPGIGVTRVMLVNMEIGGEI
jgi:hypothetical protein